MKQRSLVRLLAIQRNKAQFGAPTQPYKGITMGILGEIECLMDVGVMVTGKKWGEVRVCELGNQRKGRSDPPVTGKSILEGKGVSEHVSIDLNELDGALPLDLREKIEGYDGYFDIITNYGTLEHVKNRGPGQYWGWRNVHEFCKVGGSMVHVVPPIGDWPGHCPYHYDQQFLPELARLNNYAMPLSWTVFHKGRIPKKNRHLHAAVFVKQEDAPFMSRKDFKSMKLIVR